MPEAELAARRERAGRPAATARPTATGRSAPALQVYAALATSAATGAVRDLGSFSLMAAHADGPAPSQAAR